MTLTLRGNVSYHIQLCFPHFYQFITRQSKYGFDICNNVKILNNLRNNRNFTTKGKIPLNVYRKKGLMLTSLLLCICNRHFILCDFCFTFILLYLFRPFSSLVDFILFVVVHRCLLVLSYVLTSGIVE